MKIWIFFQLSIFKIYGLPSSSYPQLGGSDETLGFCSSAKCSTSPSATGTQCVSAFFELLANVSFDFDLSLVIFQSQNNSLSPNCWKCMFRNMLTCCFPWILENQLVIINVTQLSCDWKIASERSKSKEKLVSSSKNALTHCVLVVFVLFFTFCRGKIPADSP